MPNFEVTFTYTVNNRGRTNPRGVNRSMIVNARDEQSARIIAMERLSVANNGIRSREINRYSFTSITATLQ